MPQVALSQERASRPSRRADRRQQTRRTSTTRRGALIRRRYHGDADADGVARPTPSRGPKIVVIAVRPEEAEDFWGRWRLPASCGILRHAGPKLRPSVPG